MVFDRGKPVYMQIADWITGMILGGKWPEGERTPSVREVAMQLGVNPNTAVRAFRCLLREEILVNRRGVGYFVGKQAVGKLLDKERDEFLHGVLPGLFSQMDRLGFTPETVCREYDIYKKEESGEKQKIWNGLRH